jgi:hypothetical protein
LRSRPLAWERAMSNVFLLLMVGGSFALAASLAMMMVLK